MQPGAGGCQCERGQKGQRVDDARGTRDRENECKRDRNREADLHAGISENLSARLPDSGSDKYPPWKKEPGESLRPEPALCGRTERIRRKSQESPDVVVPKPGDEILGVVRI